MSEKKTVRAVFAVAALALAVAPVSCGAEKKFPPIEPEADASVIENGAEWAMLLEPYAIFRVEPDIDAHSGMYGRRGDIEKITGRRIRITRASEGTIKVVWYDFEKGWLPESSVAVFPNELKARNAAKTLSASD
jgi:hypothetical protein